MWASCIIVGVSFFCAAIAQYQIHRSNPKLVPLTTTVTYLILGIIAIAIPFVEKIFNTNTTNNTKTYQQQQLKKTIDYLDIDKN
jgi:hypothetical protein